MKNKKRRTRSFHYDSIDISETWWEESWDWSALMEGYRIFRREKQGRQDGGILLYIKEGLNCRALAVGDMVESFWVRFRGKVNKVDALCGSLLEITKSG